MTMPSERLWELLPGLYRARDAELPDAPLKRFAALLGTELDQLRAAIRRLADDHFVERASSDGVALLAELLGARLLHRDLRTNRGVVFNSIAWRRRRGTQPTLEDILRIATGWSAEVDEAFRSLWVTQDLRHLVPWRGRSAVLWDPIATADPLSRNAPSVALPARGVAIASPAVSRRADETLDEALRRTGRADAGHHAASPRSFDLGGWSRPDVAVIRTARFVPLELESMDVSAHVSVPSLNPERPLHGFHLDPFARDVPLVWLRPLERPDAIPTLTAIHEPLVEPPPAGRTAATLLTPTALAEDGDRAEAAGAIDISIDGVQLVGAARVVPPSGPLPFLPLGPQPVLRWADRWRPGPTDEWLIKLLARQPGGDTFMAAARATRGATGLVTSGAQAQTELGGASVALRVRRLAGTGALRDATGTWASAGDGSRLGPPLGGVIAVDSGGSTELMRPELHEASGSLRLARRAPAAPAWAAISLSGDVPAPEPGSVLVAALGALLLLAPERDESGELVAMGLYRITLAADAGAVTALVADGMLKPPARRDASAALLDGRLYLHGGAIGGAPIGDLWSIAADGSEPSWTPHPLRNPQPRRSAALIASDGSLWLLGGESASGQLAASVWSVDPSARLPRWVARPSLPFAPERPGIACARRTAAGFELVAWADSTRPRRYALADAAGSWEAGALEDGAPNPPAPGEGLFVGDELVVAGPAPLPASEVILSIDGESVLAHLPALDLTVAALDASEAVLDDEAENPGLAASSHVTYHVGADGSTWIAGTGEELLHSRQGGALHAGRAARIADRPRLGLPERLGRHFFVLRQRSLGIWAEPFAIADSGVVGLDPRLGRVLMPSQVSPGAIRVSYRVGRPSPMGAGALPVRREVPEHWQEPDLTAPTPPDLREPPARVSAWVDPKRAGRPIDDAAASVVLGDLDAAADAVSRAALDAPEAHQVIGIQRSSTLPPARVTHGLSRGLSIIATDFGATPLIRADGSGVSMALHPDRGGSRATQLWLAGLWLEGRLDLAMALGEVDLRWCTIGQPGQVSIRLPGATRESPLTLRSLPSAELELRLYGCAVGALEVPAWVRVVAAGCTFDAGSRDATALRAPGADVRLRHCTVHGAVEAGELRASSCAFAGAVRVDRRDLGWVRHSLLPQSGRPPGTYRSVDCAVAFASTAATSPGYLVLTDNNGAAALSAGELGRLPGAHDDRSRRLHELEERTADFLPVGLVPYHADRATAELNRMARPPRRSV